MEELGTCSAHLPQDRGDRGETLGRHSHKARPIPSHKHQLLLCFFALVPTYLRPHPLLPGVQEWRRPFFTHLWCLQSSQLSDLHQVSTKICLVSEIKEFQRNQLVCPLSPSLINRGNGNARCYQSRVGESGKGTKIHPPGFSWTSQHSQK